MFMRFVADIPQLCALCKLEAIRSISGEVVALNEGGEGAGKFMC